MVIKVKRIFPAVAPQLLDELPVIPGPEEVSTEPIPAAMAEK